MKLVHHFFPLILPVFFAYCNNYSLRDKLENPGGAAGFPACTECRIFVSQLTYLGAEIGGIAGADAKCNSDALRPPGNANYKALVVLGEVRRACLTANCLAGGAGEQIDWVLKPSTRYFRDDGVTVIAETNDRGIWQAPILLAAAVAGSGLTWTGISMTTSSEWTTSAGNTCGNWDMNAASGMVAAAFTVNNSAISDSAHSCATVPGKSFYCVEQ